MATKLVNFQEYCAKCVYKDKLEEEDPCWDCLVTPVNEDSHKPVMFKENTDS